MKFAREPFEKLTTFVLEGASLIKILLHLLRVLSSAMQDYAAHSINCGTFKIKAWLCDWLFHQKLAINSFCFTFVFVSDIWLNYIELETQADFGKKTNCGNIYWRAIKYLEPSIVDQFISQHIIMKNNWFYIKANKGIL